VGDYALVRNYPKPTIQSEGADIILKKIDGKWVGQDMGNAVDLRNFPGYNKA
jgi:hypothetical protein